MVAWECLPGALMVCLLDDYCFISSESPQWCPVWLVQVQSQLVNRLKCLTYFLHQLYPKLNFRLPSPTLSCTLVRPFSTSATTSSLGVSLGGTGSSIPVRIHVVHHHPCHRSFVCDTAGVGIIWGRGFPCVGFVCIDLMQLTS